MAAEQQEKDKNYQIKRNETRSNVQITLDINCLVVFV